MSSESNESEPAEIEPPDSVKAPTVGSRVAVALEAAAENPSEPDRPVPVAVAVMFAVAPNETPPPPLAVMPA